MSGLALLITLAGFVIVCTVPLFLNDRVHRYTNHLHQLKYKETIDLLHLQMDALRSSNNVLMAEIALLHHEQAQDLSPYIEAFSAEPEVVL